eukprot:CAMPEP_0117445414 /NCGR_PEP_ID=MMETSP0759-20121206/5781_1 /TAXON_ID=63605 /ORGANISM="Percolomonas cosmopolitus, Strain WS" /LENGTH=505 /DNA_ID=CAMNT_0005237585 /DNA_START=142 /DNA_END=1659 /DNA_ORIENTATION=-
MDRRERLAKILLTMQEERGEDEVLDWKGILGMREENEIGGMPAKEKTNWFAARESADGQVDEQAQSDDEFNDEDLFFTDGIPELAQWRTFLFEDSRERCQKRLHKELEERKSLLLKMKNREEFRTSVRQGIVKRRQLIGALKRVRLHASQAAQKRPISSIALRGTGREVLQDAEPMDDTENDIGQPSELRSNGLVVTGDYNGTLTLWSTDASDNYSALKQFPSSGTASSSTGTTSTEHSSNGHDERITGVAFVPPSLNIQAGESTLAFASASVDKTAKLWSINRSEPLGTLKGHADRLARLSFHPCGRLLGTASYDGTWGVWDVEKQMCLYQQEGHARAVYDVQFHVDGSLAASCDLGGIARLWDLRSGRSLFHVGAHVRKVLSVAFANNGFQFATAADDNTVKIWDLRSRKFLYRIPAHSRLITRVRFDESSRFLISSSHDKTVRIWANGEYKLIRELEGHSGVISDFDVMQTTRSDTAAEDDVETDSLRIVTCGLDRTWKMYE